MKEKFIGYFKENFREIIVVSVITIFALIMRLILLQNYGDLWLDELYSWYFANQKNVFLTVFELLKQDLHMPIYFIILHFWIKIFGNSDVSMHSCTLFCTIPLIPISFYSMKYLFNKTSGYIVAILLAINTFCIYYSIEVRFYGLVFVLSLLSAFAFVKMIENFDKKSILAFIISHTLLIYTFTITPLLTFFYVLVGSVYVSNKKNEYLKKILKVFGVVGCISIPAILFTIYNYVVMHMTLCSFSKDIYHFSWYIIFDILENFFANENFQLLTNGLNVYRNLFDSIHNPIYACFVLIPILIGILGIVKALSSSSEKIKLFLYPSLLFLMFSLLLGALGIISFLTKYASIVYPVIVCSSCYGLTQFKKRYIGIIFAVLLILINYIYLFVTPVSILRNPRYELSGLTNLMMEQVKVTNADYILIPYSGSKVMKYIPQGTFINFNADDALLLKDKSSQAFYFDKKFYKFLNRKNIKQTLLPYVFSNVPFELYTIRLRDFYFEKMKKGQRFIIVSYRDSFTMPLIQNWAKLQDGDNYGNINMFTFLMSKITLDSIQLAEEYLKPVANYKDNAGDYSVYVFEKR